MSLKIEQVTKKFNQFTAVNQISFELEKGKMLGFLGRNGAGKTTTFRMILGLSEPTEGRITYNDRVIDHTMYDHIGYLPEERGLHPKLTVTEELTYLATLKGMDKVAIRKAIDYWLERFKITENRDKKIEALSKGNQQKVQLLASMLHEPELLILDEPFSGLDPVNIELLKQAVKDLNAKGTTIIFSSHRMEHIEELCDAVCILNRGEMVVQGDIQSVKESVGYKRVVVDAPYDLSEVASLPGVLHHKVVKTENFFTVSDETVAEAIFEVVQQKGYAKRFQLMEPTMNEIFIEKVGDLDA
ncbi:ABC transporter ATP-binding protein [Staphylococcus intermedius]|uniref:ABC transporter ATP-binding protein n=1 Tax=Staphylococcus intermedius NCTC 11048 TaxID=1141106 RepID=A0A380G4E4_STAIN|nr:ABC transporter ATP-binding protein [Staphylococcus intermedius]PCF63785.1 sodium ABC transporter ATP-binding protein [Staphylococcus intermedius]PCF78500.1 sodium ABC transporter ATP-binding protein [Staphylococcus intermedius]PCF79473.1 sodium ABC transporter ATP-binding protein [Staphylococcus intermedius]PCF86790.1 sodium ABC transporter ATP-binding protein [Staphylococcus intermedius]PCF89870.1 sodium ABC transporter ATP-binding protein [Staphylococcus intermedius]